MKYNKIYKNNSNVWGSEPNKLLQRIYNRVNAGSKFLDLGCGQGRDSLFMLKNGFKVTAVDSSREGLKEIKKSIKTGNLSIANINLACENIKNFDIKKNKYAIINTYNSLHFILKKDALEIVEKIKKNVKVGGYIIISCLTADDPSYKNNYCFLKPQELRKLFFDFNIIFYDENEILTEGHPGYSKPHRHNFVKMIAQKI